MATYDPADDPEKMRALVQLAASIADQLANVACSLAAEADMLVRHDAAQHLPAIAKLIKRSARRTDAIVSDLLACAGQRPVQPRVLSIATVLSELAPMFQCMVGPSVTLTIDCAANIRPIYADLFQLEQIFCTLVARARDAIPDTGALTIRAANLWQSEPDPGNDQVCVEIADTGAAIPPDLLRRIFDPKLARKSYGLWLGLATMYGSVIQMHGRITVQSDQLGGCKFTILLPAYTNKRQAYEGGP